MLGMALSYSVNIQVCTRHFPDLKLLGKLTVVPSFLCSVAGIAAAKLVRRAVAAMLPATVAPSASTKTGRGITSSVVQDFRLSPNQFLPSLQAGLLPWRQRRQQQLGCLLSVCQASRVPTACLQSPVQVERRLQSLLGPPLPPHPPQFLRPMDTRRWRTLFVNVSPIPFLNREESKGTIWGLS